MRGLFVAVVVLCATPLFGGCGGVYYATTVNAAQRKVDQAREMGAEAKTPYEYYYAKEHLREAQHEATEGQYGDAASYAETAELYAQRAIDLIGARKGEAK